MGETITARYPLRIGDTVRISDRRLHVCARAGFTFALRREPINRWGHKMARWRARRAK